MSRKIKSRYPARGDWAYSFCGERYIGHYATREDAIADARSEWEIDKGEQGSELFVAQIESAPTIEDAFYAALDIHNIVEAAEAYVIDNFHAEDDAIELTPGAAGDLEVHLEKAVKEWAEEKSRGRVAWWLVGTDIETVNIEAVQS